MPTDSPDGSPIAELFDPTSVSARFVMSMSMAKNDVERALRDAVRAASNDDPDFSYRVRLVTGHLVEAIDALGAYTGRHVEVRALLSRVHPDGRAALKTVRGVLQKAGSDALQHVRDNTFHYPSPNPAYSPTSDQLLADVLSNLSEVTAEILLNRETNEITLTFADEVALALAMGRHDPDPKRQFEITQEGALAFRTWAFGLVAAYVDDIDASFGTPNAIRRPV